MRPTGSWHVRCTSDSSRNCALQRFDEKCQKRPKHIAHNRPRQAKKPLLVCIRIAMLRRTALALLLALTAALPAQAQDKTVAVYAAVSMKNALDDIDAAFTKTTGIKVVISLSASSALAKAIDRGMPVDVFASADLDWMDYLDKKKLLKDDSRSNLLGNRLVLIAPKESKLGNVTIGQDFDIARLAGAGRIAIADVLAVPAGKYAKAALQKLGGWGAVEATLPEGVE